MMKRREHGFTLIELLIATSVFSLILLVALAGFAGVGSLFYKGVAITQTQSISSQVMDSLRSNIQSAVSVLGPLRSPGGLNYYCVGGVRYTYNLNYEFDTTKAESASNFGLVKDTLPGSGGCSPPCFSACQAGETLINKPQEILANKMRLVKFQVNAAGGQLYNVYVNVAYGDDDSFSNLNDPDNIVCKGGLSDQRFCAVIKMSSSVYEGLHG